MQLVLFLVQAATSCFFQDFKLRSEAELFLSLMSRFCFLRICCPRYSSPPTQPPSRVGRHHRLLPLNFSASFQVLSLMYPEQQINPPLSSSSHLRPPQVLVLTGLCTSILLGDFSCPVTQIWTYHLLVNALTTLCLYSCYFFAFDVYPPCSWQASTFSLTWPNVFCQIFLCLSGYFRCFLFCA